jgi:negative regulator of sigma E activity
MNLQDRESLSALLDNEADDLELRRLLKSSGQDSDLLTTWQRYNLAQAILQGESYQALSDDFCTKVAQGIAEEPEHSSVTSPSPISQWRNSLSKVAIAASVAAVVIVGMQTSLDQNSAPDMAQTIADPAANLSVAGQAEVQLADAPITVDPVAQQLLRDYIQSVSIIPDEPAPPEYLQDSPLFRLVNELEDKDLN